MLDSPRVLEARYVLEQLKSCHQMEMMRVEMPLLKMIVEDTSPLMGGG